MPDGDRPPERLRLLNKRSPFGQYRVTFFGGPLHGVSQWLLLNHADVIFSGAVGRRFWDNEMVPERFYRLQRVANKKTIKVFCVLHGAEKDFEAYL